MFFSVIAIWLGIGGVAGSLAEVIFGVRRLKRFIFGAALPGFLVALSFDGTWTDILSGVCGLLVFVGGNAMLKRDLRSVLLRSAILWWAASGLANGLHTFVRKEPVQPHIESFIIGLAVVMAFLWRELSVLRRDARI